MSIADGPYGRPRSNPHRSELKVMASCSNFCPPFTEASFKEFRVLLALSSTFYRILHVLCWYLYLKPVLPVKCNGIVLLPFLIVYTSIFE